MKIGILIISSFSVGTHTYGTLKIYEVSENLFGILVRNGLRPIQDPIETVEIRHVLTSVAEIQQLFKQSEWGDYEVGDRTHRFATEDDMVKAAIRVSKEKDIQKVLLFNGYEFQRIVHESLIS